MEGDISTINLVSVAPQIGIVGILPRSRCTKCLLSRAAFREGNRSLFYRHEPISVLIGAKVKLLVNEIRPVSF